MCGVATPADVSFDRYVRGNLQPPVVALRCNYRPCEHTWAIGLDEIEEVAGDD